MAMIEKFQERAAGLLHSKEGLSAGAKKVGAAASFALLAGAGLLSTACGNSDLSLSWEQSDYASVPAAGSYGPNLSFGTNTAINGRWGPDAAEDGYVASHCRFANGKDYGDLSPTTSQWGACGMDAKGQALAKGAWEATLYVDDKFKSGKLTPTQRTTLPNDEEIKNGFYAQFGTLRGSNEKEGTYKVLITQGSDGHLYAVKISSEPLLQQQSDNQWFLGDSCTDGIPCNGPFKFLYTWYDLGTYTGPSFTDAQAAARV